MLLDAETIQHLHSALRALPRPLLESLTRAFRKRFQVPEAAATIADRINQKCHHDWIGTDWLSGGTGTGTPAGHRHLTKGVP